MALRGRLCRRLWPGATLVIVVTMLVTTMPEVRSGPIASPVPAASPRATPVAPGCGNEASRPIEVAEVFVAAATRMDLEPASLCFAPDRQPATWDDVFLAGPADDLSDCRGVPYTVIETKLRSDLSAVIFIFDRACAIASLDEWQRDLYDAETLPVNTVVVQVHRGDDRWYVQDAFASVSD